MAMVMGLCLLVYAPGERELRRGLAQKREASIPDQPGRPTRTPTLRRVFQLFQAVHLVDVMGGAASDKLVHGLTEERKHILTFFSPECRRNHLLT